MQNQRIWAIVAAFGDNLPDAARELAQSLALSGECLAELRELGEDLAYNAYGEKISDLIIPPAALYQVMHRYADPFQFLRTEPIIARLSKARRDDLAMASKVDPELAFDRATIYVLPRRGLEPSCLRRLQQSSGEPLSRSGACRPHTKCARRIHGERRAPVTFRTGADALCRQFRTGGGRAEAAGINHLPREALPGIRAASENTFSIAPHSHSSNRPIAPLVCTDLSSAGARSWRHSLLVADRALPELLTRGARSGSARFRSCGGL